MTLSRHILPFGLLALLGAALAACSSDIGGGDMPAADSPIAFTATLVQEEHAAEQARTASRAATPLAQDFVLYGYKNTGGQEQTVFDGYTVRYSAGSALTTADNTHGYHYVEGEQSIKFWDFGASEYHFWGAWGESTDLYTFSGAKHNVLTIPAVPLRSGEPAPEDNVLFSALYDRHPVSADVVQLNFKRPYAKVRIQFYTIDPMGGPDRIDISGITFGPDPAATTPLVNKVYSKGDVVVTYPLTSAACDGEARETVTVENLSLPQDNLPFDAVQLTSTLGISSTTAVTAPIDDSEGFLLDDMPGTPLKAPRASRAGEVPGRKYFYYPLPMGEKNPAFILSAMIDGVPKTAVVPAVYMQWRANHEYTYVFKVNKTAEISFSYLLDAIIPWQAGVSGSTEW